MKLSKCALFFSGMVTLQCSSSTLARLVGALVCSSANV